MIRENTECRIWTIGYLNGNIEGLDTWLNGDCSIRE